jgi:predicted short-subunit dehydrogenase-like oxidoreductase (DUF2520 family)
MPPSPPSFPLELALVGAGRVGTAVARLLARRGHRISGVWSRTPGSAERAAVELSTRAAPLEELSGDLWLMGVTDDAIASLATRLVSRVHAGAVVCHFAGALGTAPLRAFDAAEAWGCALHPVQSCPEVAVAVRRLPGSAWGVTCAPPLERWCRALIEDELEGLAVVVDEGDRPLWHAAAVTVANGISALMSTGETMLEALAAPARDVLAPLAGGALENARERGAAASLTGPIVRGDAAVIARHLEALRQRAPGLLPAYVAASRLVLVRARDAGRIGDDTSLQVAEVLDRAWS